MIVIREYSANVFILLLMRTIIIFLYLKEFGEFGKNVKNNEAEIIDTFPNDKLLTMIVLWVLSINYIMFQNVPIQ